MIFTSLGFYYLPILDLLQLRKVNIRYHKLVTRFLNHNYTSFEIIVEWLVHLHGGRFLRGLGSNPCLTLRLIDTYKEFLHWDGIGSNPSLTMEWLNKYRMFMCNYHVSRNPALTPAMIERHIYWLYPCLTRQHPSVTPELIEKYPELSRISSYYTLKVYERELSEGITLTQILSLPGSLSGRVQWKKYSCQASLTWMDVLDHPELSWYHRGLLENSNWK